MKAQSEILNFMLLLLILTIMMFAAYFWAAPVFENSSSIAKKAGAEQFIRNLDSKIQSIAKSGGYETINYDIGGSLQIKQNETDTWIEYKNTFTPEFTNAWFYLSGNESFEVDGIDSSSIIRERKKGNTLYIELWYRKTGTSKIELTPAKNTFTRYIKIEKLGAINEDGVNKILVGIDSE